MALEARSQAIATVMTWVLSRAERVLLGPGPSYASEARLMALLIQLTVVFVVIGALAYGLMGRMDRKGLTRLASILSPLAPWVSQALLVVHAIGAPLGGVAIVATADLLLALGSWRSLRLFLGGHDRRRPAWVLLVVFLSFWLASTASLLWREPWIVPLTAGVSLLTSMAAGVLVVKALQWGPSSAAALG
jgi:hypothetical protein